MIEFFPKVKSSSPERVGATSRRSTQELRARLVHDYSVNERSYHLAFRAWRFRSTLLPRVRLLQQGKAVSARQGSKETRPWT